MPEKLPVGWVKTALGEVCLPVEKIRPENSPDTEFTYFDIGGIDNEKNRVAETKTIVGRNAPSRARQALQKDDILFSTVRTYLRKIARLEREYANPVASTGFSVIRAADGVSSQFLLFQMLSDNFLQPLHALQTGSSYPAVRARDIFAQPLLLPPTREQERIVAKLSVAVSGLERAEIAVHRAQERLVRYRAAVIKGAVTGELTRAWRQAQSEGNKELETGESVLRRILNTKRINWETAERKRLSANGKGPKNDAWKSRFPSGSPPDMTDLPELPKTWSWASLEMIAEIGSGISVSQNRKVKNPVELPYLRVANVLRGYFDLRDIKTIRVENDQVSNYLLWDGDILFTEGGDRDKLGRGWVWEGQIRKCLHQNHIFRARTFDASLVNPKLVSHWGNTFGQHFFLKHGIQTTNLASINRGVLSKLPVPIASAEEQSEILREVAGRLGAAAQLATKLDRQMKLTRSTYQSLLREAFAGRLVPQNPDDEPASLLLERIRAIRECEAKKPKGKRMPKSSVIIKMSRPRNLLVVLKESGGSMTPEELFRASGHSQESVDQFFAELRELTASPAKLLEERKSAARIVLRAIV